LTKEKIVETLAGGGVVSLYSRRLS